MSWFDETLVILNVVQKRKAFLTDFHSRLALLNVNLELNNDAFICFNDTRTGEEKEPINLSDNEHVANVIQTLAEWPALGILTYRHPNFSHEITIDYLTWDDVDIHAFTIGFNGKEVCFNPKKEKSIALINQISDSVDYKYAVGNIYGEIGINPNKDLSEILKYIEQTKFTNFDKRK